MRLLMTLVMLITIAFRETCGYGKMIDPLNRSSLWRKSFRSRVNRTDDNLNCGGPIIQYNKNRGKCGECGDDYSLQRPRPNENGGIYGKGMIGRAYMRNSIINVTVELLGSHQGQFNFDICPLFKNNIETSRCFYRLSLANNSGSRFNVTKSKEKLRYIVVSLKLPLKLVCNHCVLRWQFYSNDKYFEESEMMPIGYKATWRNCADVAVLKPMSTRFLIKGIPNSSRKQSKQ